MLFKTTYFSPIGKLTMVSDGEALVGLWIEGQKYFLGKVNQSLIEKNDLKIFDEVKVWLDEYFNGENPDISKLKLSPEGSDFQKEVWNELCQIPYGKTLTYGEIAKAIARKLDKAKMSAQCIGGAVGHNRISIIIPCHRVVGSDKSLTGYAGGLNLKIKLLEHEGIEIDKERLKIK